MTVSYQGTLEDFVEAARAFSGQRWYGRWASPSLYVIGTLTIVGTLYYAWEYGGEAYPLGLILGVTLLALPAAMRAGVVSTFKQRTSFQRPVTLGICDEAVEVTTAESTGKLEWSAFHKTVEAKNVFLLFLDPLYYIVVPKRAFTPEQLAEFRELLARKIPQKK